MSTPAQSAHPRLPLSPLRVFRVDPGMWFHIRTLSDNYGGLFTHYVRGRSVYCRGPECTPTDHRTPFFWKGYASVEVWHQASSTWNPVVLEITERLELDFRGIFQRGQVWEVWRESQGKEKNTPVMGKLLEERNPDDFPAAYNFLPVLQHMYHQADIETVSKNPMPERILVEPSRGDGPKAATKLVPVIDPEDEAKAQKILRDFLDKRRSPSEKAAQL